MKTRFISAMPSLAVTLALGAMLMPAGCQAQTATAPTGSTLATTFANAVRIYPRAGFAAQMAGGEIQGSNESATGGFVTLAKIDKAPREGEWTRIAFNNTRPYRFLRYFGPAGSYSTVAEIEFLSGNNKIEGTPYGTFGSRDNSGNDYNKAFDGDTKTFFDAVAPNAQYLGIEIKSGNQSSAPTAPLVVGNGLRAYHIGNSLTDGMNYYTQQLAIAAGYKDHFTDRQTIPGAPLWMNYKSEGGFGTPHRKAFVDFAPLSDLVMQTFISNSDSEDPEFSLKFYEDARVKSPNIRPWIYGQWESTAAGERDAGSSSWELRNRALMRIYLAHALNFNAATRGKKTEVIPGGLALINLKQAFDAGKVPGSKDFFATNFSDDLHLSEAGRQFIGMVIFSTLYNQSPVGLPIVKIGDKAPEITPEQNKVYQQAAWDTVQSFRKDNGASLASAVPGEVDVLSYIRGEVPVRHSRLGQLDRKEGFQYVLNAAKTGKYDFRVSAFTDKTDGTLDVLVNHKPAGSVTINPGKEPLPADSSTISIDLQAGLNSLRLQAPEKSSYQLNSIKITPAGQALKNTLPLFDLQAWDEEVKPGETSFVRDFRVNDAETPVEKLLISATSDNPAFVPTANIKIESGEFKGEWGNVYNRRVTVTPVAGQKGEAWIVLTVKDAQGAERQQRFRIRVK
jgi:hypothetical protein